MAIISQLNLYLLEQTMFVEEQLPVISDNIPNVRNNPDEGFD